MSNLVGKVLSGRYRVDELLGQGGMAEVYKVWDQERATYLALKLLKEDLAQDVVFLRRFRREASSLDRLQHPNIVRFYGLEQDDLLAFILMDYIAGSSLKTKIYQSRESGMDSLEMLNYMRGICSALHFAHRSGTIHCDLKPGNVLIDEQGKPLVTDFGIARLTDAATATMVGIGTPAYMAPEQVKGLDPVPQTDIYALGIVLYEMLTGGERPFTGENANTTGATSAKVRWEQVNLPPPSPRKFNLEISPELEAVVLKCLAKDPGERYKTPLDVVKELEQSLTGKVKQTTVPDNPPAAQIREQKEYQNSQGDQSRAEYSHTKTPRETVSQNWWRRWGGWLGAGGILIVALVVILAKGGIYGLQQLAAPTKTLPSTITPSPIPPTLTPEPIATPIVYNVEINVVDEEGNSIPEAKIIQDEIVEFTDDQGVWRKSFQNPEFSINVWAQGYLLQEYSSVLNPGDHEILTQLLNDPFGIQDPDLTLDGYELVFVEDFQDNISDCIIDGNGAVVMDDSNQENQLLLVDLRNLDEGFTCSFGPTNIENAIIEVDFRYVDIRYNDFEDGEYFNWQGYGIGFRDGFSVEGYPLQVEWGPQLQINDFTEDEWKFPLVVDRSIREARWYKLSTKYDENKVEVRMDGSLQFNYLNPPTMINTEPAHITAFSQAHIQFDNIKMWIPSE